MQRIDTRVQRERMRFSAIWLTAQLLAVLYAQQLVNLLEAQTRIRSRYPDEFNPLPGFLSLPFTMWDQRSSWQGGGELCWVALTLLGVLSSLMLQPWRLRWIPIIVLAVSFGLITKYAGAINTYGTTEYCQKFGWLGSKMLLAIVAGVAVDVVLRRALRRSNEEETVS